MELVKDKEIEDAVVVSETETEQEVSEAKVIDFNPRIEYEYADLVIKCNVCGEINKTQLKGLPKGQAWQFVLVGANDSKMVTACEKCKTSMELQMIKSSDEDIAQYELDKQKVNEEVQKDSKTIKMDVGVSEDTEPSTESNS